MLFDGEEREKLEINLKPGLKAVAEEIYEALYPYAEKVNLDDFFEQILSEAASYHGLADKEIPLALFPPRPRMPEPQILAPVQNSVSEEDIEIDQILGVDGG